MDQNTLHILITSILIVFFFLIGFYNGMVFERKKWVKWLKDKFEERFGKQI